MPLFMYKRVIPGLQFRKKPASRLKFKIEQPNTSEYIKAAIFELRRMIYTKTWLIIAVMHTT